jgi:hypothetical protein
MSPSAGCRLRSIRKSVHLCQKSADRFLVAERREAFLTRYRIYRNSAEETTYISAHDSKEQNDPQQFPNLNVALAALRESGIPEYEIVRVTKELDAINGAIVQVAEKLAFDPVAETTYDRQSTR